MAKPSKPEPGCVAYVPTGRERKGLPPIYGRKAREKKSNPEISRHGMSGFRRGKQWFR